MQSRLLRELGKRKRSLFFQSLVGKSFLSERKNLSLSKHEMTTKHNWRRNPQSSLNGREKPMVSWQHTKEKQAKL